MACLKTYCRRHETYCCAKTSLAYEEELKAAQEAFDSQVRRGISFRSFGARSIFLG